jgi:hypothetical protein
MALHGEGILDQDYIGATFIAVLSTRRIYQMVQRTNSRASRSQARPQWWQQSKYRIVYFRPLAAGELCVGSCSSLHRTLQGLDHYWSECRPEAVCPESTVLLSTTASCNFPNTLWTIESESRVQSRGLRGRCLDYHCAAWMK